MAFCICGIPLVLSLCAQVGIRAAHPVEGEMGSQVG